MSLTKPSCWHPVLVILHWATALLVLGQYGLSRLMRDETRDLLGRFALYQWHKSIGLTVAGLVALRLALRLITPAPAPADHIAWQGFLARAVHLGLYACLLALPLTGLLMVSAAPIQIPTLYFGWFGIPHPIGPDKGTYELMLRLHEQVFDVMTLLVLVHLGGVAVHHFVWRDGLPRRMWFTRRADRLTTE
ncbi:cytochrome b/b6 domain-containing protein [Bosea sp. 124]|uniref:cytochrome b n=1 Tax=Bosea sp. 124 TaxID=2135642 RepID=UPI000D3BBF5E|nr:cytochrome b/b6 domain-containing protein [Bosea sp. 124]PTM39223.1 cytochrome b561 [Bosea sp. 124]